MALELDKVTELYGLLEYTKTQCDYYAPKTSIPGNGVWSAATLLPLATPLHTGWFVPMGTLNTGRWLLRLTMISPTPHQEMPKHRWYSRLLEERPACPTSCVCAAAPQSFWAAWP